MTTDQRVKLISMPPFNPDATCVKCANESIRVFHRDGRSCWSTSICERLMGYFEKNQSHLHRVCSRCGFEWVERPLDMDVTP